MIHRTRIEDAEVDRSGWYGLDVDTEVTRVPLVDSGARLDDGTKLFARLTYRDALAVAARLGARLIDRHELELVRQVATRIEPYPLTADARMTSLEWSERHDIEVWRRVRAAGWTGGPPVLGAGKHWIAGAPAGRAHLMGWWTEHLERYGARRGAGWVQQPSPVGGSGPHDDSHHDYATTTMLVRARGGGTTGSGGPGLLTLLGGAASRILAPLRELGGHILRPRSLGLRALDVAREEHRRGVRELPGPRHSPDIQRYLAGTRRGGTHTAGFLDDRSGAFPLGNPELVADETEWCAAAASWCTAQALRPEDRPPHGYRCSVRELVEDARALGTLHLVGNGYEPRVGDLAIQERVSGESPLRGGRGHVSRVAELDGPAVVTLGGNEGDRWMFTRHERPFRRIVAWVRVA